MYNEKSPVWLRGQVILFRIDYSSQKHFIKIQTFQQLRTYIAYLLQCNMTTDSHNSHLLSYRTEEDSCIVAEMFAFFNNVFWARVIDSKQDDTYVQLHRLP